MKVVSKTLTIVPVVTIVMVALLLLVSPTSTYDTIANLRLLVGDTFSSYYLILGVVFVALIFGISVSKYGKIKLGEGDPEYSTFTWGSMIFTSTMAADILFYSFHEWSYYYQGSTVAEAQLSSATYPLLHWGITPWSFYILPAMAYAYLMHRKKVNMYRLSTACEIQGSPRKKSVLGTVIDIFALLAMLAASATTFSLATPLMSEILCRLLGIGHTTAAISILILTLIAVTYIIAVLFNMKGISQVAKICVYLFCATLICIIFNSNFQYTIETGLTGVGNLLNNFLRLSTETGSLRLADAELGNTFTQDYTVFYWAYWISWALCTPIFIARISRGRTLRQVGIGALVAGITGTFTSFLVFGNFGLYNQVAGNFDMVGMIAEGAPYASAIVELIATQTAIPTIILALLFLSMLAFYTSTFDTLTMVMSQYTCKKLTDNPPKYLKIFWGVVFIVLPIALLFTEGTLSSLQSLSIIAALPISVIFIRIVYQFFKNLHKETL